MSERSQGCSGDDGSRGAKHFRFLRSEEGCGRTPHLVTMHDHGSQRSRFPPKGKIRGRPGAHPAGASSVQTAAREQVETPR